MPPKLRDNEDLLLERLGRLIRVLERKEFGGGGDQFDINIGDTGAESGDYFSTGAGRYAVPETEEWDDIEFGLVAEVINIRTTDDIEVAFADPNNSSGQAETIRAAESPFTIGGSYGIGTDTLWVRRAESAGSEPGIEVIAYN